MPLIQAWQCPETQKLFVEQELYQQHLKVLARERRAKRIEDKRIAEKAEFFRKLRAQVTTLEEAQQMVIDNWEAFVQNGIDTEWDPERRARMRKAKVPKLLNFRLAVTNDYVKCGNTHSAPLGGVENFFGTKDKPTSYWGWRGRFQWQIDGELQIFPCKVFVNTGFCTGSGSGGRGYYNGDIILFGDDWPTMQKIVEERMVMARLLEPDQNVDDFLG